MKEITAYALIFSITLTIFTAVFEFSMSYEFANALYTIAGLGLAVFGGIAAKILLTK